MFTPMPVIPALDLRKGQVVHAMGGQRAAYPPLRAGSEPVGVLHALLRLYPFPRVYLADLDALQGGRPQTRLARQLAERFPAVVFWLDAGRLPRCRPARNLVPVLASEAGIAPWHLRRAGPAAVLSLDFQGSHLIGNPQLLRQRRFWPRTVIVMQIDRVGSRRGPYYQGLRRIRALPPHREIYAAGGVRGWEDLRALQRLGIRGALVASALHARKLPFPPPVAAASRPRLPARSRG